MKSRMSLSSSSTISTCTSVRSLQIGAVLLLLAMYPMFYIMGQLRCSVVQNSSTVNNHYNNTTQHAINKDMPTTTTTTTTTIPSSKDAAEGSASALDKAPPTPPLLPPLPSVDELIPARMTFVTGRFSAYNQFANEVSAAEQLVKQSGFFPLNQIYAYSTFPDFVLQAPGYDQHKTFLTQPGHESNRGAGFWFWKPLLLLHHLDQMKNGDILVYIDTDEIVHLNFVPTLVRIMNERRANFVTRVIPHRQAEWTKRDIYEKHCPDINPNTDPWLQNEGGRLVIRKCNETVRLFNIWASLMLDYHLVSDEPSVRPNIRTFEENRHDQSMYNVALNCLGNITRPTERQPIDLCVETKNDPTLQAVWTEELIKFWCDIAPYVTYNLA